MALLLQAYAISAIARWDWPENWPDLFDQLIPALGSGEPNLVHGTMRVLSGAYVEGRREWGRGRGEGGWTSVPGYPRSQPLTF